MPLRWIICLSLLSANVWAGGPVATVRVAFDRDGITAIRVHGFADKATGRKVGADDPVRIASISRLVTTLSVMRLLESGKADTAGDHAENHEKKIDGLRHVRGLCLPMARRRL